MKLQISGKISREDMIEMLQFFRDKWKERTDVLSIIILEGTQDMSIDETRELLNKVFRGKDWTELMRITKTKGTEYEGTDVKTG